MCAVDTIDYTVRATDTTNTIGMRLFISLPICQDILDLRRVGQSVNILEILLGDLEWAGSYVGNVFPNQLAGVDGCLVDLLEKETSERFDS